MQKIKHQFRTLLISVYNGIVITAVCLWFVVELIALVVFGILKHIWEEYLHECEKTEAKIKKIIKY